MFSSAKFFMISVAIIGCVVHQAQATVSGSCKIDNCLTWGPLSFFVTIDSPSPMLLIKFHIVIFLILCIILDHRAIDNLYNGKPALSYEDLGTGLHTSGDCSVSVQPWVRISKLASHFHHIHYVLLLVITYEGPLRWPLHWQSDVSPWSTACIWKIL